MNTTTRTLTRAEKDENTIIRAALRPMLAEGYSITVNCSRYEEPEYDIIERSRKLVDIIAALRQTDEDVLTVHGTPDEHGADVIGWLHLIHGNHPSEIIADYTTNLEPFMDKATEASDKVSLIEY